MTANTDAAPSQAFEEWASEEGINNSHFNHCWAAWRGALAAVSEVQAEAAQDFKANERDFASILIEQLCELTDRNSPACKPDEMVATPSDLRGCIEKALDKYCFVISGAGEVQSGDALTRELLATLQAVVKHFTKTPSSLVDSQVRGRAHEVIAKTRAQIGYGELNPAAPAESGESIRTHTTQPGESVMGIALRQCGNENEWRHILACNPRFADLLPSDYFPVGTVLTLPPVATATQPVQESSSRADILEKAASLCDQLAEEFPGGAADLCAKTLRRFNDQLDKQETRQ